VRDIQLFIFVGRLHSAVAAESLALWKGADKPLHFDKYNNPSEIFQSSAQVTFCRLLKHCVLVGSSSYLQLQHMIAYRLQCASCCLSSQGNNLHTYRVVFRKAFSAALTDIILIPRLPVCLSAVSAFILPFSCPYGQTVSLHSVSVLQGQAPLLTASAATASSRV